MSIYSDYEYGAISDEEFRNFGVKLNRMDRQEGFFFEPDFDDLESLDEEGDEDDSNGGS